MRAEALRRIVVFGLVGGLASLLHIAVAGAAMRWGAVSIFVANMAGFALAFLWSYAGHYWLTFRSTRQHRSALPRFALTALAGYGVNNGVVLGCVLLTGTESLWFIVLAVGFAAIVVYLVSSRWAMGEG